MVQTWSGTPLVFGAWLTGADLKMAMCKTKERRMTCHLTMCRGSVLTQNAHEDFTTYHVRRMIVRSLSDPEPALGGRDRHEKMPSWLTSGFMDDSLRRPVYTHECEPSSYSTLGMWVHLRACVGSGGFPHRGIVCTTSVQLKMSNPRHSSGCGLRGAAGV